MSEFWSPDQWPAERVLGELAAAVPEAIVIGGMATWIRTGGAKTHDIDLIVGRAELERIGQHATVEVSTARHSGGRKWRGTWDGVHMDLYVPYESKLGSKLQLRVEQLQHHVEVVGGHRVLTIPAQIAAKWAALVDRPHTLAGSKDAGELLELLKHPAAAIAPQIIVQCSCQPASVVRQIIAEGFGYLRNHATPADRGALQRSERQWLGVVASLAPETDLDASPAASLNPTQSRERPRDR